MQSADCLMPSQSAKAVLLCQGGGGELGGCGQLTVYFLNFLHLLVGKHVDHRCHLSVLSLCVFPASVGGTPASFLSLCLGAALAFAFLLLSVGLVLSGRECDCLSPLSGQRWSRAPCLQARPVFLTLGVWDCQVSTLSIFVPVVILFITECFLFLPRFLVTPGNLER